MTEIQPGAASELEANQPQAKFADQLRVLCGSVAVRSAIIALKLMLVFVLSQKNATFFYQQF